MKTLVPYVTGGITADWTDYLHAYQDAGADKIEVGLPFSDPMLDGTTIQQASDRALARGATVETILDDLARASPRVPIVVMTYANLVLAGAGAAGAGAAGVSGPVGPDLPSAESAGVARLAAAGVSGLVVPDLPLEESAGLEAAAADAGVELALLAAPVTPDDRLREICSRSRGFVYAVSVMDTTGERATLPASAATLARRIKAVTALPALIGFGVSTPAQAAEAGRAGDGVVIASTLMRRVLGGARPRELASAVAEFRAALDLEVSPGPPHAEVSAHRG